MNDKDSYYITVGNLKEESSISFNGKATKYDHSKNVNPTCFVGDAYFDSELVKNRRNESNYRDGLLVARIHFMLSDIQDGHDSMIWISRKHLINEFHIQEAELSIGSSEELFVDLREAVENNSSIRVKFSTDDWKMTDDYEFKCNFEVERIDISSHSYELCLYEEKRVRHIENYLITEFCCGSTSGQIPLICKELSKSFSNYDVFQNRFEMLEKIIELLTTIKWIFNEEKSDLRNKIENSDDSDFRNLFNLYGDDFYTQFIKISDVKERREVISEYNNFWKKLDVVKVFHDGYIWSGSQLSSVAEEYMKIPHVSSPTLNAILIDGLLIRDIYDVANGLKYKGMISDEAVLSVRNDEYIKTEVGFKNKSIFQILLIGFGNSLAELFGLLISGVFFWFVTSLISGSNELAHFVLFGTLFGASMIVSTLNKSKSSEAIKDNVEEKMFYILRDMCHVHRQSGFMNVWLIKNLMLNLEERGIAFDRLIYSVLERHKQ